MPDPPRIWINADEVQPAGVWYIDSGPEPSESEHRLDNDGSCTRTPDSIAAWPFEFSEESLRCPSRTEGSSLQSG